MSYKLWPQGSIAERREYSYLWSGPEQYGRELMFRQKSRQRWGFI